MTTTRRDIFIQFATYKRKFLFQFWLGLILCGLVIPVNVTLHVDLVFAGDPPPNVILILVDDQGWNGTSVRMDPDIPESQSDFYQTPTLEKLAATGMRFSNAYSAACVCTPTRAAILMGKSPAQLQTTDVFSSSYPIPRFHDGLPLVPPSSFRLSMDLPKFSLPARIKQTDQGYVTAHYGKWHLAAGGFPSFVDMGYDFGGGTNGHPTEDPRWVVSLTEVASEFIADRVKANEPFFLQLSHRAVHSPIEAFPETIEKYSNLPPGTRHANVEYAAMTEDLDTYVGVLIDKVHELGIAGHTYVIYYSDNGARRSESTNAPLLRGKSDLWEGGIRVPLVMNGPGIAETRFVVCR